jgi:thiol:disulfide interchange protein DsbD
MPRFRPLARLRSTVEASRLALKLPDSHTWNALAVDNLPLRFEPVSAVPSLRSCSARRWGMLGRASSRPLLALFAVGCTIIFAGLRTAPAAVQPNPVTIEMVRLANPLSADRANLLYISAHIAEGWHINSNHPSASYYIPTRVSLTAPADVKLGGVIYPAARNITLPFAPGESLSVFSGAVRFEIPIATTSRFSAASGSRMMLRIYYQACNDRQCLRPASVVKVIDLGSLDAAASGAAKPYQGASGFGNSALADIFTRHGDLLGFVVVLLGGLALNLTPCVYPLIGVTVAYFGYEGGGPRKLILLAFLYVLGIALTFSAVGVAAAFSGGLFGAALQNPYVLGSIAVMLLVLATGSFGLFSLQPPAWLMRRAGTARPGYAGAVVMGLGMGVVAAPCIGPLVLGLLLMVQQSASVLFGFMLFFTLAVGLGLPYIAVALAAGSIRHLPRSGEWLGWIEQLFGFALVGLAAYFIDPLVPHGLVMRSLPYYAAGVGIFLGFLSPIGRNWRPFFVIRTAIGVTAVAGLVYLLIGRNPRTELTFQPFEPALLAAARSERKPVVVDFSADWCVPCREMERTTFTDPAVVRQARNFVRLRADLTASNARNAALVKQFSVAGVPTTIFIDATGEVRLNRVGYIGPRQFLTYLRRTEHRVIGPQAGR